MNIKIQALTKKDIPQMAVLASQCFNGLKDKRKARKWIMCNFSCFPRMQYFIIKEKGAIFGYILWLEKGGFRQEAVWELEQIAVDPKHRGRGIATTLIEKSLVKIIEYLKKREARLKLVEVTTGTENRAQRLYQKTLDAQPEAVIKNFFRGDELIMLARF